VLWDELDLPDIAAAPELALAMIPAASTLPAAEACDRKARLLTLIGAAPIGLDDLVRASGAPAREVSQAVFELELDGVVQRHAGGALSRRF
jgi:DNA processing protein